MGIHYDSVVDEPIDEVFAWFSRPGAIYRLIPPWQPMRVIAEADSIADGRAVLGMPIRFRWQAQHLGADFDPPYRFVDEWAVDEARSLPQLVAGPWRHEHTFRDIGGTATEVIDDVHTRVPGALLRSTFVFRHRQLAEDLWRHRLASEAGLTPQVIAVTGSSGLVGRALCAFLTTGGHRVIRLVRGTPTNLDERQWHPNAPAADLLDGVDAVIHLAGESIAGRFTDTHKRDIADSRVGPTRALAHVASRAASVRTFISASAIGIYGADRPDELLDEGSTRGAGFLADVVADWEAATAPAGDTTRVVQVRTGIVQSPRGGPLQIQRPIFAAGLGGRMGSGRQWLSWIDLEDLIDIYHRALFDDRLVGPVNAVAPEAVTGSDYAATLGRVLHRPALFPVPSFGPALLLGREGTRELAEADQRVIPARLLELGHQFRRRDLADCLKHQLGR